MKILVVDDNIEMADLLADVVRYLGHEATAATDGHQALALLAANDFDLAIIDLMMPPPDGLEVARQVRVIRPTMKLLGVSGIPSLEDAAVQQHLFPLGILHKPFVVDDVRQRIESILPASSEH